MQENQKNRLTIWITITGVVVLIAGFIFYWHEIKPQADKKSCYKLAETRKANALEADNRVILSGQTVTRANYDQIFDNEYSNCLKSRGY